MTATILAVLPIVMLASLVRGYLGFGFAAICVVGLNFFMPAAQSIVVALTLDAICSLGLLSQAARQMNVSLWRKLLVGSLVGIPLGMLVLYFLPEHWLKLLIGLLILFFSVLLAFSVKMPWAQKNAAGYFYGMVCGIFTSAASVGGPVIVCYLLSSRLSVISQRATMVMFFITVDVVAICALMLSGMVEAKALAFLVFLILPTFLCVKFGEWLFNSYPPKSLKKLSLPVMTFVASSSIAASVNHWG